MHCVRFRVENCIAECSYAFHSVLCAQNGHMIGATESMTKEATCRHVIFGPLPETVPETPVGRSSLAAPPISAITPALEDSSAARDQQESPVEVQTPALQPRGATTASTSAAATRGGAAEDSVGASTPVPVGPPAATDTAASADSSRASTPALSRSKKRVSPSILAVCPCSMPSACTRTIVQRLYAALVRDCRVLFPCSRVCVYAVLSHVPWGHVAGSRARLDDEEEEKVERQECLIVEACDPMQPEESIAQHVLAWRHRSIPETFKWYAQHSSGARKVCSYYTSQCAACFYVRITRTVVALAVFHRRGGLAGQC
jgi:hypothetical protein